MHLEQPSVLLSVMAVKMLNAKLEFLSESTTLVGNSDIEVEKRTEDSARCAEVQEERVSR